MNAERPGAPPSYLKYPRPGSMSPYGTFLRRPDRVQQCRLLGAYRKIFARTELFSV